LASFKSIRALCPCFCSMCERAPLDPEVARRVDERAARITEQIRRTHGVIDDEIFQTLLADDES
jgi:hypothetical protein